MEDLPLGKTSAGIKCMDPLRRSALSRMTHWGKAAMRGTTAQGEYRSHARMAMIEPSSWDLNEVKVQSSPFFYK